jgi:hypothetical protein
MLLYAATDLEVTSAPMRPEVSGRANDRRSVIQRHAHDHVHFDVLAKVDACVEFRGNASAAVKPRHQLDERDQAKALIEPIR